MPWWPWSSEAGSTTIKQDVSALKDDLINGVVQSARERLSNSAADVFEDVKKELTDLSGRKPWIDAGNVLSFVAGASLALSARWFAAHYLRRVRNVNYVKPELLRQKHDIGSVQRWSTTGSFTRRRLLGRVTSVGDGDNFHFYHTPGGWLAGWSWARSVPSERQALKGETIHVRMAGIDAPELAHFGRPAQPFGEEALAWLRGYILQRRVRVELHRRDQYDRVVGTAWVRRGLFRRDVSLEMLKTGLATVYEGSFGVEFGGYEKEYRAAEKRAKERKVGMWTQPGILSRLMSGKKDAIVETPREFKTRMSAQEKDESKPARSSKKE